MTTIDINSDLGEGFGHWQLTDDDALLGIVTSANVACGFHASDPQIMHRVCERAAQAGVAIGAQVSYRDLAGFGRRFIDVEPDVLRDEVIYQIGALDAFARISGSRVRYVKPHGGLYNTIAHHEQQAAAVAEAVAAYDGGRLPVLGLPASVWLQQAQQSGLTAVPEAFADRAYTPEGMLVPRRERGSVLHDADEIAARCVAMATGRPIHDCDGGSLSIQPASICVHGDTPGAVGIGQRVRAALAGAGITVESFAG
jgi:UPF0271 protein